MDDSYIFRACRTHDDELCNDLSKILKNPLIAPRASGARKERGDSMNRKTEVLSLMALVVIAGVLGIMAQTYAQSAINTSTAASDSIAFYVFSTSATTSDSTCPLPPQRWASNQTDTSHPPPPWMANLTSEQKQALNETVTKMQSSGATREEIRNAVDQLLNKWGVQIPQRPDIGDHQNPGNSTLPPPQFMANLTDTQKQTLNETVTKMQASGATREELRSAVDKLLTQWGIQIPQHNGVPLPPQINAKLTTEQKETLNATVTKMEASGASREQIMNAVHNLLTQWGIEFPQCPP